jgi:hypothetical protein
MEKLKDLEDSKQTIDWLLQNGDFKDTETAYNIAMNSINRLDEAINYIHSCKQLCECGGNERIALDCTMKPCKHPKYYKK